jgi:hypothetical protein
MDASREPARHVKHGPTPREPHAATLTRSDLDEVRSWSLTGASVLILTLAMVVLTTLSIWFGYLDIGRPHPALKLSLSMVITVWGLGIVLLVRLIQEPRGNVVADAERTIVALLLMSAAVIHFAVIRQHFLEYWLYGVFFAVAGIGQLVAALLVVVRPRLWLFWAVIVGDAFLALTWVITRTYGTLIGPDAHTPEEVGFGDVVSTVFEVIIVVLGFVLIRSTLRERAGRSSTGDVLSGFLALAVAPLCALSLYSAVAGSPFVSHVG